MLNRCKSMIIKFLNQPMKNNKRKLKSIVLSMVLAVGMLLSASVSAQEVEAETGGRVFEFGKLFGLEGQLFSTNRDGEPIEEPIEVEGFSTETGGGLFGFGKIFGSDNGLFGTRDAVDATITGGIQNDNFEVVSPLGSGIAILLVAGLGYVALKKKEDEQ
jgi:hypothetical protein